MEVGFLQETKSILKSLVLSSPNGMTLERLNRDYKEMVGNWIPFKKLGFPNLELFLRSIPDTLVVTGYGLQARIGFVASEKVNHINEMISRQKNTTRERKSAVIQTMAPKALFPYIQQPQYNVPDYNQQAFNTTSCGFSKSNNNPLSQNKLNNNDTKKHIRDTTARQQSYTDYRGKTSEESKANNCSQAFSENKNHSPSKHFSYKTKAGLACSKSEQCKGENISQKDVCQPNYTDGILLGPSSSFSFNTTTLKKGADKYDDNKNKNNGDSMTNIFYDKVTTIKGKDKIVSSNAIIFPSKSVLPKVTSQNTVETNIIKQTTSQMQNASERINPFSQNDTIENDDDIDEAVPEFAANGLVFRLDFPEHTVGFGQKIPRLKVPKELVKGSVVGVFISEIHSPFKFWFHIYKENHELDILMNRIECFYSRLSINELVIPKNCLAPGHVCAALYKDIWHRAEVLTNVCNNKVKVNFFDYGTVSDIGIQNIKYLPEMFAHTPMQAIRGSLSHIKPVSSLWPKSAVIEFLSMVSEILLYAQIMEVDEKDRTVYMVLCDTNGSETVQINKQLVDKGFAKLDNEWDENKIAKNGYRKRHPRDIFPTFEMLETGEYPSLSELENLLAQGIDYETQTGKIILFNVNNNNELILRKDHEDNALSFNLLDTNPFKNDIISEIVSLKIFGD